MGEGPARPRADVVLALLVIAFAAIIHWQTMGLPPPRYEPLGSAALPRALAGLMALFALIILIRSVVALVGAQAATEAAAATAADQAPFRTRPGLAVTAYLLTAGFVLVMDLRLVGFVLASLAFVFVLVVALARPTWRQLPWIAGFTVALALGSYVVFTKWFYIDLP